MRRTEMRLVKTYLIFLALIFSNQADAQSCNTNAIGTNRFIGCLWDGTNFNTLDGNAPSGPVLSSPVPDLATALDFKWGSGTPSSAVGNNTFSARWKGMFTFKAGTYIFTGGSDDGIRVRIGGITKLNRWFNRSYAEDNFSHVFANSGSVPIEVDFYENTGSARVNLRWTYTSFDFPVALQGTAPEEKIAVFTTPNPTGFQRALLAMSVFDPDYSDEGLLYINGNGPIGLFGNQSGSANNNVIRTISYEMPASWWKQGNNTMHFVHTKTAGYIVYSAIVNFTADTIPPNVTIKNPRENKVVFGLVKIEAEASDNVGVSRVEFYIDSVLRFNNATAPYVYLWNATQETNETHVIKAVAYDAAGNSNGRSITVKVDDRKRIADLNGDGEVNILDILIMILSFGKPGITDLNKDGKTDLKDIGIVLSKWTATFDFSIASGNIELSPGKSGSNTVTVNLISGSSQTVALSAFGLPPGANATFSPGSGLPTYSSTLTITTLPTTPAGNYTITIIGTGDNIKRETTFTLTVKAFDFFLSISPMSGSLVQGGSVKANVTATLLSGTPQPVTFSCSGLPAGALCSFSLSTCYPTCSSILNISTSSNTPLGSYNITISATSGSVSSYISMSF